MSKILRRFLADDRGASTVEFGLIGALVALAILGTLSTLGSELRSNLSQVQGGRASDSR